VDGFDADVIIFAARGDPRGRAAIQSLAQPDALDSCVGSLLLLPETLSHTIRHNNPDEQRIIERLLENIDLKAVDRGIAQTSVFLRAKYGLKSFDAIHLATAIEWGADRFHTHNSKDFGPHITEIEVVLA
jgi:predicted nucleic acid-binding protein